MKNFMYALLRIALVVALLIAILHTCTANAAGFYVEGAATVVDQLPKSAPLVTTYKDTVKVCCMYGTNPASSYDVERINTVSTPTYYRHDVNEVGNPYAAIAFGYDYQWRAVTFDLQAQLQKSVTVNDHLQKSLRLSVRWYPFGGAR